MAKKSKSVVRAKRKRTKGYHWHSLSSQQYIARQFADGIPASQLMARYQLSAATVYRWYHQHITKAMANSADIGPDNEPIMPKKPKPQAPAADQLSAEQARIQELEAQLRQEQMRAIALKKLIDVAEKQLGIDIRKKRGTQQ
jgi:transposase-like protein